MIDIAVSPAHTIVGELLAMCGAATWSRCTACAAVPPRRWKASPAATPGGLGLVGPAYNFGFLDEFQLWVCTAAMLLGRLELLSVLVLFTAQFWRK